MSSTLAQLEQEVARRVGPYTSAFTDRQVPNTAQFTFANIPTLRSELDLDSVTHLWLLRRGVLYDGTPLSFDVVDRQRLVANYDPEMGRVYPDRPWGAIPQPGEAFEFHHFDPEQQLRTAVLAGLRRCYLPDTVQAQPQTASGPYSGLDLTAQFPWLTEPWQVQRSRYGWYQPYADAPFDTYTSGGHLILIGSYGYMTPLPPTTTLWLDAWRPAWSWVNSAESATGPTADDDVLDVDLDYAASAGHIEAWHLFPARMQAAAASNLQATREQASAEFSRLAGVYGPGRSRNIGFQSVVRLGGGSGHRSSWINGPW